METLFNTIAELPEAVRGDTPWALVLKEELLRMAEDGEDEPRPGPDYSPLRAFLAKRETPTS
jgi:hypothetical protein